jgi:hypothetical protein
MFPRTGSALPFHTSVSSMQLRGGKDGDEFI